MDYKSTVNLPKTEFPMRAELPKREPLLLKQWQDSGLYERILERRKDGPAFILHDGPPFANGDAHMGHGLNITLKDIVLKSKNMTGHRVPFVPGWDCHGLPIEHKVMKELGGEKAGDAVEVRRRCAAYATKFIGIQREQFKRLGVLGDWEHPYITMEPAYEAEILRVFATLVGKGLVYQSLRPVYWSTGCQTALAEAEVEYADRTDPSVFVEFPVMSPVPEAAPNLSLLVWTTTPWTLPANLAVAVNPLLDYAAVQATDETYVVAVPLLESVRAATGLPLPVIATFKGDRLVGADYQHPFLERTGKVYAADFVTSDAGTGFVHIAPGHGADDYQLGMKHGLAAFSPVDDNGKLTGECGVPALAGRYVFDANAEIVEMLRGLKRLAAVQDYTHSYPHCWRSKTPIIFRSVKQWFIKVDAFRQQALDAIDHVTWFPAWGRNRIRGAVESRPDWCISRQRTWGVPIPVFYGEGGQPMLSEKTVRAFADVVEQHGTGVWFEWDETKLAEALGIPRGPRKGRDTLDVWIDSGTSWAAVSGKRPELACPADLYLEGSDQHRGWFQSSLLTSIAATGQAPYRSVLTNGFVADLDGKKLSKSKGAKSLAEYVDEFGADILRLWVASEDFRNDVPFSEEIFKRVADTYRTLRNTLRILLGNLNGFDPSQHAVPESKLTPLDAWLLTRFDETVTTCRAAYDAYEFHAVYHAINRLCAVELSSLYVDMTKDRMYCDAADSPRRRAAQTTMHTVLSGLCRLLAPLIPFTAEEAWLALGNTESVHLQLLPEPRPVAATAMVPDWTVLHALRDRVNADLEILRRDKKIGKSLEAAVTVGETLTPERNRDLLAELFNVSQIHFTPGDGLAVGAASGKKCVRCWKVLADVGTADPATHPDLCPRCTDAVTRFTPAV